MGSGDSRSDAALAAQPKIDFQLFSSQPSSLSLNGTFNSSRWNGKFGKTSGRETTSDLSSGRCRGTRKKEFSFSRTGRLSLPRTAVRPRQSRIWPSPAQPSPSSIFRRTSSPSSSSTTSSFDAPDLQLDLGSSLFCSWFVSASFLSLHTSVFIS